MVVAVQNLVVPDVAVAVALGHRGEVAAETKTHFVMSGEAVLSRKVGMELWT